MPPPHRRNVEDRVRGAGVGVGGDRQPRPTLPTRGNSKRSLCSAAAIPVAFAPGRPKRNTSLRLQSW